MTTVEARGLVAGGQRITIAGLTVLGPGDAPWCKLDARDYRARPPGVEPTQIVLHTEWGVWPQRLVPGAGPAGRARGMLQYWADHPQGRREYAGAHLVVDADGRVYQAIDVVPWAVHHARAANPHSIGIEVAQARDGTIYAAAIGAAVQLAHALATGAGARRADGSSWPGLWIPWQCPGDGYRGAPIARLVDGGRSFRGVYGHRDQSAERGRGDPGDHVYEALRVAGCEPLAIGAREDIEVWRRRQARLVALGETIAIDGIAGRATLEAMRRRAGAL